HGQRGGDGAAAADAAGGEHRQRRDRVDDLRPQDDAADLARMTAALGALGDHDVDAGLLVLARLLDLAAQGGDQPAGRVDLVDDLPGWRAQRVGDEAHLGVVERAIEERPRGRLGPAEQAELVLGRRLRHAVLAQQLVGELEVRLRDRREQHLLQLLGVALADALVLLRDDDVDAVLAIADALVDPGQLALELLRREADRAEHAEAAGPADRDHHVAAVGEGEDGDVDAQAGAQLGLHTDLLEVYKLYRTC